MNPTWFIQTNIDGIDTGPLIQEVRDQGMAAKPTKHHLGQRRFGEFGPPGCVICYGDIDFVRQVQKNLPHIPGAWCNFNNMKCSTYYAHFGEYLLNQYHWMMPVGEVLRRWEDLFDILLPFCAHGPTFHQPSFSGGHNTSFPQKSLFVRPDSGAKSFTGFVVDPGDKHKIESLVQSIGPETLVVVAPKKNITAEWRYVVCDREIVVGSRYLPDESGDYHEPSSRLAITIASQEWQPDLCYTVDIAAHDSRVYLLEINSFSCSAFYSCDLASIVKFASLAAEKEWREYCDPNA